MFLVVSLRFPTHSVMQNRCFLNIENHTYLHTPSNAESIFFFETENIHTVMQHRCFLIQKNIHIYIHPAMQNPFFSILNTHIQLCSIVVFLIQKNIHIYMHPTMQNSYFFNTGNTHPVMQNRCFLLQKKHTYLHTVCNAESIFVLILKHTSSYTESLVFNIEKHTYLHTPDNAESMFFNTENTHPVRQNRCFLIQKRIHIYIHRQCRIRVFYNTENTHPVMQNRCFLVQKNIHIYMHPTMQNSCFSILKDTSSYAESCFFNIEKHQYLHTPGNAESMFFSILKTHIQLCRIGVF